jgi:methylase of polypeptide subunit release factors
LALNAVVCDLIGPLKSRLRRQIDVLIFNPPYVPTEEEEVLLAQARGEIAGAWAGGHDGMAVTNRLLEELDVSYVTVTEKRYELELGILDRALAERKLLSSCTQTE